MRIICKLGTNKIISVEVSPDDHLYILLEKLMQNAKYGVELGTEPDMAYFGMSETKRMESYKFGKASAGLYETFDTTAAPAPLPDCPNDYEYH